MYKCYMKVLIYRGKSKASACAWVEMEITLQDMLRDADDDNTEEESSGKF